MFGKRANLSVDLQDTVTSYPGALLTILIITVVSIYAWKRMVVLKEFDDTVYQETIENLQDPQEIFKQSDTHFNIAIGVKSLVAYGLPA